VIGALSEPPTLDIRVDVRPDVEWREAAQSSSDASLAHAPEWFSIIRSAYGHDPLYLSGEDHTGRRAVLPAFVIRRPFAGSIVTSMPFLDSGGPCGDAHLGRSLVDRLIAEAGHLGADAVDIRCAHRLAIDVEPLEHKVNMILPLPQQPDQLWSGLASTVRNQIRKAERSGLTIECARWGALPDFYSIFATRMRELGSPVHGRTFFEGVLDAFGSRAQLMLVRKGDIAVGGLIALSYQDTVVVPWASCLKEYFALCPNMLLYWETIRSACAAGFRRFDFGRSTRDCGTYKFKRQWGAGEQPLFWYTVPLRHRRARTLPLSKNSAGLLGEVWQRLPLALTRQVGPHLRKYLIQ
jgi:FemAB-related protein (PEP-CTERM system-associated)